MDQLPGYIPMRLIPIIGLKLTNNDGQPLDIGSSLKKGVRMFKITFDMVVDTDLLHIASDFVTNTKNSDNIASEAVIIMYHKEFCTDKVMPKSISFPNNVIWKFNYTDLKLADIRGKIVMLDSKEHKMFENLKIYNKPEIQKKNDNSQKFTLYFSKGKESNKVCIQIKALETIDQMNRISNTDQTWIQFVEESYETYDNCHKHEGPMVVTCSDTQVMTEEIIKTFEEQKDIITPGTLAIGHPLECELISRCLNLQGRWKGMVEHLLKSSKNQVSF